jgi:DNA-binding NarL/FixJ family response regulator
MPGGVRRLSLANISRQRLYCAHVANKTYILIIDADCLMRDGLYALLSVEPEVRLLGAFEGVHGAARATFPKAPDIVIVDIAMANPRGIDAIAKLRERWSRVKVLVLTFENADQVLEEALRAGADGYLLKSDTRQELLNALERVKSGQRYVSPTVLDRVVHGYVRKHALVHQQDDGLSDRERDVMRRIAQGRRTREIARELSLSHKTIEKYRGTLMRKLGLKTATAVAAYAIAHGYLEV